MSITDFKKSTSWYDANQRCLSAALAVVSDALEQHAARVHGKLEAGKQDSAVQNAYQEAAADMPAPSALETLCRTFGLSSFERDVLLLCAGVDLDSSFADRCASAQGDPSCNYPTFSLALAALPEAHWSALTPDAPLRRWRLIEIEPGNRLTFSPLRIDERVLHCLTGVQHLDERLAGMVEPLKATGDLVPSHEEAAKRIVAIWLQAEDGLPIIQLCGKELDGKQAIAVAACEALGLNLNLMFAYAIPLSAAELNALVRLLNREAVLSSSALLLDCEETDTADAARESAISRIIQRIKCPLIVASRDRRYIRGRFTMTFDVSKPTTSEQWGIWQKAFGAMELGKQASCLHNKDGKTELDKEVDTLVSEFNMSAPAIQAVSAEVLGCVASMNEECDSLSPVEIGKLLWDACRAQVRPRLDDLAQHIDPVATWDDLVLPEPQLQILREMAVHVRQRMKVYETWGFATKSLRGLGISALFAGPSGTGKTMASEVLANELRLDLYRIDLASVVSKYIGETEKNLRRVFDAAEGGGSILLFDEADALFGKRSEVKDSHDRYANIEISYLLQRMEAYRGLAILTTNMKSALDAAFMRRIRFVVQFPFPDAVQRAQIWRHIFPQDTPTKELDWEKLARLNVTGGNIRNIAMNAAFLAADDEEPVQMRHLLQAARTEYAKMEKTLTDGEIRGWIV